MSSLLEREGERPSNRMLEELADGRRRRILSILLDRSAPVDEAALADRLVADERGAEAADPEETRSVRVELRHVHLPALAEAGLVRWDEGEATVSATEHPSLEDPAVVRVIETDADGWDEVVACLANDRRRAALAVLVGGDGSMHRFTLARDVAAREGDGDPSTRAIDEVLCSLHHVHLSKLQEAGLIEYDPDEETVAYDGRPELETALFDDRPDGTPRGASSWLVRCIG